ncbi:MAG: BREX-1 system adenine-specific DNA-methyltransferase PglX, partial [Chloroflexota bacterium]|nr:BREX-1 system adenine-specific DNA-methyltransferase PglX [Chloroflexota bacterium]
MPFDKPTRNLLAKTVAACRDRLADDVADQLQSRYGLYPDGTVLDVARTEDDRRAAEDLRALLAHFGAEAAETTGDEARRAAAYQRLVREIGFTTLNRLAALRLCEQRGLLIECVRRGMASDGFQLYDRIAGGALGNRYQTYRAFIESLFDELALDLGVLFDHSAPQSLVFPSEAALTDVLALLNDPELAAHDINVWQQDETIGWIYQYYNDPAERKAMRKASQAPRNSRELAVRNQFFTPRYVVEFLTDNTLGRLWYEMRQGHTRLAEQCRYLVRRPEEDAETGRQGDKGPGHRVTVSLRPQKDPRDLKILDPAGGSGHFLLYSFDLLLVIYEEAWADPDAPPFTETGTRLAGDYADLDTLRRAVPGLILRHNLHGIDIDPRAVQIAALALWLRAQRAYQDLGLDPAERPRITRTHLVTAEPMPGDRELLDEFLRALRPRVLGDLVRVVFEKMALAGEAGSLLKIEEELADAIAEAHRLWASEPQAEQLALFPQDQPPTAKQPPLFDVSGITDAAFWETAEERVLGALRDYAARVENGQGTRRRLFAEDAARGFAFVDLCQQRFDVTLMNPPFGEPTKRSKEWIKRTYPKSKNDILGPFIERCLKLTTDVGCVGAITTRTAFSLSSMESFRKDIIFSLSTIFCFADLGDGVLDTAMVNTAAYALFKPVVRKPGLYIDLVDKDDKGSSLAGLLDNLHSTPTGNRLHWVDQSSYDQVPGSPVTYWADESLRRAFSELPLLGDIGAEVKQGLGTTSDFRFVRAAWETSSEQIGRDKQWSFYAKGGESSDFYSDIHLLVNWAKNGKEIYAHTGIPFGGAGAPIRNPSFYFRPGLTYTSYTVKGFSPRALPSGCIFTTAGMGIFVDCPLMMLALLNSSTIQLFLLMITDERKWEVGYVKSIPIQEISTQDSKSLEDLAVKGWSQSVQLNSLDETQRLFITLPELRQSRDLRSWLVIVQEYIQHYWEELEATRTQIDSIATKLYRIDESALAIVESRFGPSKNEALFSSKEAVDVLTSYLLGITFGRWDVRVALESSLASEFSDPFAYLPVCSPGMLIGPDGLPATPGHIVSEAWLRARPDAITLPPEGSFEGPATIPDSAYPISIAWDGILVDDPGLGEHPEPHPSDVVRRVRQVLALLWPENHAAIEAEANEILSVRKLRDYFRKPSGFFADHLKRYSKSRRKAPIYWPLSTPSGSYTLWLYYHRLDDQLLYTAVNRYVAPKIEQVEAHIARLEAELSQAAGRAVSDLRDQLDETRAFLAELREFRAELLRIAALPYKPNLNDGVIINAAPLHKLFRLRKWAQDIEAVWHKLEAGDYDWAHLAYTLWPDRVREVCKRDR